MATRSQKSDREVVVDPATGEVLEPGSDVATVEGAQAPAEREGDLGLAEYLVTETAGGEPSPEQAYRMIIDQILNSETPEDVLVPVEAISAREFIGEPFILEGFAINKSDFEVGSPFYASLKVTILATDDRMVINTGNQAVLAQLVRLSQLDAFPQTCMITEGNRPNRFGTKPLRLRMAEQPRRQEEPPPGF